MRQYKALDLVQLPRADAMGARALANQILVAVVDLKVPAAVLEAVGEVRAALGVLETRMAEQLPDAASAEPARARGADVKIDACWASLYNLLVGWSRLPDSKEGERANVILAQIFPDGLAFTRLPWREEWVQSDTRLMAIDAQGFAKDIDALGATKILKTLRQAHKDYGVALAITAKAEPKATATMRDALLELQDALRNYVVQASAIQRKNNAKTLELSEALLAPIATFQVRGARDAAASATTPAPGAPPDTPAPAQGEASQAAGHAATPGAEPVVSASSNGA